MTHRTQLERQLRRRVDSAVLLEEIVSLDEGLDRLKRTYVPPARAWSLSEAEMERALEHFAIVRSERHALGRAVSSLATAPRRASNPEALAEVLADMDLTV